MTSAPPRDLSKLHYCTSKEPPRNRSARRCSLQFLQVTLHPENPLESEVFVWFNTTVRNRPGPGFRTGRRLRTWYGSQF